MNIFDFLRDILVNKKGNLLNSPDQMNDFVPFMVQRWISMHSKEMALIMNSSSNILWRCMEDKNQWYHLFLGICPKTRFKKIQYLKKVKKETVKSKKDALVFLAKENQLSKREVQLYEKEFELDLKKLVKQLK